MTTVGVLLPAHDEAGTIEDVVRRARSSVPALDDVLVVDDGSSDGTGERARAAGARVLRLEHNAGKGEAVRQGLREVRGEVIVLLDADGQDDPEDIPRLLQALVPGVDMVVGSRFLGHFEPGAITPLNRAGNLVLTGVVDLLYRARLTDTQAGFRAFRRTFLDGLSLSARRYDIEVDLLLSVLDAGGRVVEVPVRRRPRRHGTTGLDSFRDGARILRQIVRRRARSLARRARPAP